MSTKATEIHITVLHNIYWKNQYVVAALICFQKETTNQLWYFKTSWCITCPIYKAQGEL